MLSPDNVDAIEIERFNQISAVWWDTHGEMGTLHTINPLRLRFITENNNLAELRVLDVGCGGGILSEAMAKAGAQVTAIDLSQASIIVAKRHAETQGLSIDYRCVDVAEFAAENAGRFNMVTCMEMLEHVPQPEQIIAACAMALKPGGQAIFSTINRTLKAYLFAILIGEKVLHLLPRGSHKYYRLIRPQELNAWAAENDLAFMRIASLMYNPLTRKFTLAAHKEDVNYLAQYYRRN